MKQERPGQFVCVDMKSHRLPCCPAFEAQPTWKHRDTLKTMAMVCGRWCAGDGARALRDPPADRWNRHLPPTQRWLGSATTAILDKADVHLGMRVLDVRAPGTKVVTLHTGSDQTGFY